MRRATSSLHPPFARLVVSTVVPLCVGPPTRLRTAVEGHYSSAPGALAQVRVIVSRTVITYSAPSAPVAGTSRFHRMAAYTRCLRCAHSHMPRHPTTGSELSSMLFHNMSPSTTTGNPSAVYTQYFTENAGLQLRMKVSAFPSSSHSDSGEGHFSRLDYGSLALRVAVGTAVTRCPPHRPVLALLVPTVPTF